MINPDAELNRLRSYLGSRNWVPNEVEDIVQLATRDVNEIMLDIISNAVAEVTDYAADLGAEEFIEEMDVVEIGGGFMISTLSGRSDYSIPERRMMSDLLKGAKIAEDGSRYKVIPIGKTSTTKQPRDIFSVMQQRDSVLQEARQSLNQQALDHRSARAQTMASHFKDIINRKLQERVRLSKPSTSSAKEQPIFRTVSDKQDESTQWVIPAKEMDMTGYLMDMNKKIQDSIYSSVLFIVESYEKEFA